MSRLLVINFNTIDRPGNDFKLRIEFDTKLPSISKSAEQIALEEWFNYEKTKCFTQKDLDELTRLYYIKLAALQNSNVVDDNLEYSSEQLGIFIKRVGDITYGDQLTSSFLVPGVYNFEIIDSEKILKSYLFDSPYNDTTVFPRDKKAKIKLIDIHTNRIEFEGNIYEKNISYNEQSRTLSLIATPKIDKLKTMTVKDLGYDVLQKPQVVFKDLLLKIFQVTNPALTQNQIIFTHSWKAKTLNIGGSYSGGYGFIYSKCDIGNLTLDLHTYYINRQEDLSKEIKTSVYDLLTDLCELFFSKIIVTHNAIIVKKIGNNKGSSKSVTAKGLIKSSINYSDSHYDYVKLSYKKQPEYSYSIPTEKPVGGKVYEKEIAVSKYYNGSVVPVSIPSIYYLKNNVRYYLVGYYENDKDLGELTKVLTESIYHIYNTLYQGVIHNIEIDGTNFSPDDNIQVGNSIYDVFRLKIDFDTNSTTIEAVKLREIEIEAVSVPYTPVTEEIKINAVEVDGLKAYIHQGSETKEYNTDKTNTEYYGSGQLTLAWKPMSLKDSDDAGKFRLKWYSEYDFGGGIKYKGVAFGVNVTKEEFLRGTDYIVMVEVLNPDEYQGNNNEPYPKVNSYMEKIEGQWITFTSTNWLLLDRFPAVKYLNYSTDLIERKINIQHLLGKNLRFWVGLIIPGTLQNYEANFLTNDIWYYPGGRCGAGHIGQIFVKGIGSGNFTYNENTKEYTGIGSRVSEINDEVGNKKQVIESCFDVIKANKIETSNFSRRTITGSKTVFVISESALIKIAKNKIGVALDDTLL